MKVLGLLTLVLIAPASFAKSTKCTIQGDRFIPSFPYRFHSVWAEESFYTQTWQECFQKAKQTASQYALRTEFKGEIEVSNRRGIYYMARGKMDSILYFNWKFTSGWLTVEEGAVTRNTDHCLNGMKVAGVYLYDERCRAINPYKPEI